MLCYYMMKKENWLSRLSMWWDDLGGVSSHDPKFDKPNARFDFCFHLGFFILTPVFLLLIKFYA